MKKRFILTMVMLVWAVAAACANENVRAVQAKLKASGFYFGEVDGALSSEVAAAITRYQIRNGLQITGNLNAETSKALGVQAEVAAPAGKNPTAGSEPPPAAETWRRLRKSPPPTAAAPASATPRPDRAPAASSATAVLEPIGEGKVVLKRERLRDYVGAFVLAGLDPHVGAELEFFAEQVHYYNDGMVRRPKIQSDLVRYDRQWPQRRFWLAGELEVKVQPDSRIRVTFPLRYEVRNGSRHASGKVRKTLLLEVLGDDLEIVGVDETKA
ncbi:MAG: peptidoglycan-binding domain-containing protein [Chthoniobacterales bacterium]